MEDKTFNRLVAIISLLTFLTLARTVTVGVNHLKISDAILDYQMACIHKFHIERVVDYEDMEDFKKTWLRLWDWSHKRILSDTDYRTVKPYVGKDI